MRIVKKITYKEAKKVDKFKKLEDRINSTKKKSPNHSISKKPLDEINYYLVIESKNLSEELGFGAQTNNFGFGFFSEKEKHQKFLKHIRKKNSQPSFFKKIGLLYDIVGCYLVATTKEEEEKITIYKSSNTVLIKLNMNKLPSEIENMCREHEENQIRQQQEEDLAIDEYFSDSDEDDRDKIIDSIVSGILFIPRPFQEMYPEYDIEDIYHFQENPLNIEDVIESKLDDIYDITFLKQIMDGATQKENYELCAKIRDRINFLKEAS